MKKTRKWVFYSIYILVITVFFLFYLFPSEAAKQYLTAYFKQAKPGYDLKMNQIRPVLPMSIRFENVDLAQRDTLLFSLDRIKLTPNPASLLGSKSTFYFQGYAYDGMIKGKFDIIKIDQNNTVTADAVFSDLHLTEMSLVRGLAKTDIFGKLNGRLIYAFKETGSETVNARFHISDFKVDLIQSFLNIRSIMFNQIEIDFQIVKENVIIRRCTLKGPQMDGELSGSILFKNPAETSVLNIAGRIKPHHLLLAEIGKEFQALLFSKTKGIESGIKFKISGTPNKPGFYLQ